MEDKILLLFEKILTAALEKDVATRLMKVIVKMPLQEQIFLLQFFDKYPTKIPAFWEISKKKFDLLNSGVGDMDEILKEEVELFQ